MFEKDSVGMDVDYDFGREDGEEKKQAGTKLSMLSKVKISTKVSYESCISALN